MIAYTVRCTFREQATADEWVAWLDRAHIADVMGGGAIGAEVIRLDGDSISYEVRYRFRSRRSFELYERIHAPRLRAEGLERFPLELGLSYERSVGEIVCSRRAGAGGSEVD